MSERFVYIGLFFASVLVFTLLNRRRGYHDLRTFFDSYIPFWPIFVIPYIGLFPYIAFAMWLLFATGLAIPYYLTLSLAMFSASIVWFLIPAKMFRPHVERRGVLERLVYEIYRGDPHANAFPSSHVFTSTITSYFLYMYSPDYWLIILPVGLSIALSTVFIKQHHFVDVLAGFVWATGAIVISTYIVV